MKSAPKARSSIEEKVLSAAQRAKALADEAERIAADPAAPKGEPWVDPLIARSATLVRLPRNMWATCETEVDVANDRIVAKRIGVPAVRYVAEDQLRVLLLKLRSGRGQA